MARGIIKIISVVVNTGTITEYTLVVDDAIKIAINDHISARISGNNGSLYRVIYINDNTIVVSDDLNEA